MIEYGRGQKTILMDEPTFGGSQGESDVSNFITHGNPSSASSEGSIVSKV